MCGTVRSCNTPAALFERLNEILMFQGAQFRNRQDSAIVYRLLGWSCCVERKRRIEVKPA